MLRLVYSNRTEELLAEVAVRIRAQQAAQGALAPVRVIVPNATVAEYLRLGIARECGIAANLHTMRIQRFAAETVEATTGARTADAEAFEAMALTLLLDDAFTAQPDLEAVRAHLAAGKSRDAEDARRVELAARIGRLFEQYTHSRADLLAGWPIALSLDVPHAEAERWQRRFWLAMFGEGGLARTRGLVPLPTAIAALPPVTGSLDEVTHVFGFAHFAPVFHDLFARLARTADLWVYSLSPCEGFWEDYDARDPTPLRLWGRPGREHVRALNAAAAFDHEDRFVEPNDPTLLGQLQRDLLRRVLPAADEKTPAFERDESFAILEHASVRRELEGVASEIWRRVERDRSLRFDEIAVVFPELDADAYLAHLPAVFREAHDIPHRLVDLGVAGDDRIIEAVELLLALPLGRFTRQDLLRLMIHPAVVASLDDVDPSAWVGWCDALGIVHGADRADHEDTYIERDILNWDQGLRRLALGAFMSGDASGERRPFEVAGQAYVPQEVGASDTRDAAALGLLARSLVADARFLRGSVLLPKDWALLLGTFVETYVAPASDADAERLAHCLRGLHAIGGFDLGDKAIPYRIACELARGRIAAVERGRGAEGVVVSRLGSVQPIPFRVVFACGMGEGRFPSADAEDPLDLRRARRREGDVTARERDKYGFLELLLGARERLYVSYVSRDPLTGDALAPASVVQELLHAIGAGYVGDVSVFRRRHPLRRWDPTYFPDLFAREDRLSDAGRPKNMHEGLARAPALGPMRLPEAQAEARTLAIRQSMESAGAVVNRASLDARSASDDTWASLAEHLRAERLPEVPRSQEGRIAVPMYALVRFLEFPLQGWARYRVGLDEFEDDDAIACEDEPFETDFRDETMLLRGVFFAAAGRGSIERAYDDVATERELRGTGPSGVFAQGERSQHLGTLAVWREKIETLGASLDSVEVHRFGRAGEHAAPDEAHLPLLLEIDLTDAAGVARLVRVEISGRTVPLCGDAPRTSVALFRRNAENKSDWARADRERSLLRAFVDHAVLSAAGLGDGRPHSSIVVVAGPEGAVAERVVFDPMSRGEATAWLRAVVRALLVGSHAYFFPCEAVFVWHRRGKDKPVVSILEEAREMLRDGEGPPALRSTYGPVPRSHAYPIPDEATARSMIAERFGVLFEKRREAT